MDETALLVAIRADFDDAIGVDASRSVAVQRETVKGIFTVRPTHGVCTGSAETSTEIHAREIRGLHDGDSQHSFLTRRASVDTVHTDGVRSVTVLRRPLRLRRGKRSEQEVVA